MVLVLVVPPVVEVEVSETAPIVVDVTVSDIEAPEVVEDVVEGVLVVVVVVVVVADTTLTTGIFISVTPVGQSAEADESSTLVHMAVLISLAALATKLALTSSPVTMMDLGASPGTAIAYVNRTLPLPAKRREKPLIRRIGPAFASTRSTVTYFTGTPV